MESSILSLGKGVGSECLEEPLAQEILTLCSLFEDGEVVWSVIVVNDHVVTGSDESVVLESTKSGHAPTIVALGVGESNCCR